MKNIIFDCKGNKGENADCNENRTEGNICQNKNRLIYKAAGYKKIINRSFFKLKVQKENKKKENLGENQGNDYLRSHLPVNLCRIACKLKNIFRNIAAKIKACNNQKIGNRNQIPDALCRRPGVFFHSDIYKKEETDKENPAQNGWQNYAEYKSFGNCSVTAKKPDNKKVVFPVMVSDLAEFFNGIKDNLSRFSRAAFHIHYDGRNFIVKKG